MAKTGVVREKIESKNKALVLEAFGTFHPTCRAA